jgi:rhodanese-related sulfurtransferase
MNRNTVRWLLGLALVSVIGMAVAWRDRFDVAALQTWVESAGSAAPLAFIALYAAATVLFLPGSVITLAGGVLFGPVWGTLWSLTGATLGAALAFLIARYLGGDWIARRAGPRLSRLKFRAKPMLDVEELKRQLDAGEEVLQKRMADLEDYRQSTIRLVCRTDRRSTQAAQLLTAAGFIDAQPVRGGMTAWLAKGWPSTQ